MLIANQAKALSLITGNNIENKLKKDPDALEDIIANVKVKKMDFEKKEILMKKFELYNCNTNESIIFNNFNSKQIYNLKTTL